MPSPTVLEELQSRLDAAKKRHAEAAQNFQKAQVELNQATAELNIWTQAVGIETREAERRNAEKQSRQQELPLPATTQPVPETTEPINKTEFVRQTIGKHAGINADDLWSATKDVLKDRAYMYSILKRLRDRDEIMMRRKKYFVNSTAEEVKEASEVVIVQ